MGFRDRIITRGESQGRDGTCDGLSLGWRHAQLATVWPAIASADNKEFSQGIAAALRDSGRLVDYSIGVTSKGSVVYLEGRVANKDQMIEAVQMTSNMPGVSKVVNHLEIKPSAKKATGGLQPNKVEVAAAKLAADAQGAVGRGHDVGSQDDLPRSFCAGPGRQRQERPGVESAVPSRPRRLRKAPRPRRARRMPYNRPRRVLQVTSHPVILPK